MKAALEAYSKTRDPSKGGQLCYAPSVNLNFEQNGNATACCYNRRFILGRYPKDSLQDIWNGDRVQELRELLRNNDLSKGCQLCEEQLLAGNFSGLRARSFDRVVDHPQAKTSNALMPRIMEFEISNTCNLECVMCNGYFSSSIRRNREKLEPFKNVYDDAFVDQLRPFLPYLVQAKFLGGEPFLNPIYYKIWDAIAEVNPAIDVVVTTNASIMNAKVKDFLNRLRPTISISCDSLDKKTYELIRKNGSFDRFRENLDIFLGAAALSGKTLAFGICPMTNNWKTIPDVYKFSNENKVCFGVNTVIWPPDLSIKSFSAKKMDEVIRFWESECSPLDKVDERWWYRFNYDSFQGMINQIKFWQKEKETMTNG